MSNIDREDKTQADFKLSPDKWQRFQVKCKDNGGSASEILNLLIDIYLGEEINHCQALLLLNFETQINEVIAKYIRNKLDNHIDRYIEQKLVQQIEKTDSNVGEKFINNVTRLENIEHQKKVQTVKYDDNYKQSSITAVIEEEEEDIKNKNFTNNDTELKTARELAEFLHCSPAYITTLNRLGDLEKRGWIDSGKRHGKAILYEQIKI
ncbi:MAG: hypothetical protein WBA93_14985 [Microcoleaceae cyanobacterium]